MKTIDNVSDVLKEDLKAELKEGSKLSIAAACFSIYAFQELKKELQNIEELRFLFTSPTFTTEKEKKKKENSIFPDLTEKEAFMVLNLRSDLEMNLAKKLLLKNVLTGFARKLHSNQMLLNKT